MVASPWLDIPLADYEGHMALPEIAQARMLADELESAVRQHAPTSVAIIGCSGGNGFERLIGTTVERVVGLDINPTYLAVARARFDTQLPKLALYVADVQELLPNIMPVEMIFAGLIFEYVDLRAAMHNLRRICAQGGTLVAVLQEQSADAKAVSPSPYRSLQQLAPVMRLRHPQELKGAAVEAGLAPATTRSLTLSSGKSFIVMSFDRLKGAPHNGLDYL
jgi:ubiquinone/menaquinone biosynthesis C-methylase UbiE